MARTRTLPSAARSGDRLTTLESLRDRLAREIADTNSARDVAALSKELRAALAEIDALAATAAVSKESETFDELSRRRADRGADPARGQRPAGRQPG